MWLCCLNCVNSILFCVFSLLSVGLWGLIMHLSNMWNPSHPGRLPSYKQWGTGLKKSWIQPGCVTKGALKTIGNCHQCVWHIFSRDTHWVNTVQPWNPVKQPSPLVMWVHSRRTKLISTSPQSQSFTSPWSAINATPLLGFLHDRNVLMKTETALVGLGLARWAWTRLHRSVIALYFYENNVFMCTCSSDFQSGVLVPLVGT